VRSNAPPGRSAYITEVSVSGFKALGRSLKLKLAPLTVFFGPNATGKTSVIEAIYLCLQQYFEGEKLPGPIRLHKGRRYGEVEITADIYNEKYEICRVMITPFGHDCLRSFDEKVSDIIIRRIIELIEGDETLIEKVHSILFGITPDLESKENLRNVLKNVLPGLIKETVVRLIAFNTVLSPSKTRALEYHLDISMERKLRLPTTHELEIVTTDALARLLYMLMKEKPHPEADFLHFGGRTYREYYRYYRDIIMRRRVGREVIRAIMKYIDKYSREACSSVMPLLEGLRKLLPVIWVPAWRDHPRVSVNIEDIAMFMLPPVRYLTTVSLARELAFLRMSAGIKDFEDEIADLGKRFKLDIFSTPRPKLKAQEKQTVVSLDVEREKISYSEDLAADGERSLHVLLYALNIGMRYGGTLLIEEPELHIHPKLHHKIADMVATAINEGAQVIVSTHSDHFIAGIMSAIAEGRIDEKLVKAYYFRRKNGRIDIIETGLTPKTFVKHGDIFSEFVESDLAAYNYVLRELLERG